MGGAGTGGSGMGGVTAGSGGVMGDGGSVTSVQALLPDATGWVDRTATGSTMIQGAWFGYSDGLGLDGTPASGDCERLGSHPVSECSNVASPTFGSFPNIAGKMCTRGTAAQIVNVVGTTTPDYNDIWGAGIAFNLNANGGTSSLISPYNAITNHVTGIGFDIDSVPLDGLRVELTTPGTTSAAAFWGGDVNPVSPVHTGHNQFRWADVKGPFYLLTAPVFDPTQILTLQFHIQPSVAAPIAYSFCVSNLVALMN